MPGFASICNSGQTRGRRCEALALSYFKNSGHELIARNLPLIFAEIDLAFLTANSEIWLIEVKSVSDKDLVFYRPVKTKQKNRLRRALEVWSMGVSMPVRLHLAAVNHRDEIAVHYDFLTR